MEPVILSFDFAPYWEFITNNPVTSSLISYLVMALMTFMVLTRYFVSENIFNNEKDPPEEIPACMLAIVWPLVLLVLIIFLLGSLATLGIKKKDNK